MVRRSWKKPLRAVGSTAKGFCVVQRRLTVDFGCTLPSVDEVVREANLAFLAQSCDNV